MKIGIVCAGERELAPFLDVLKKDRKVSKSMLVFHEGYIAQVRVVLVESGICKVNAAIASQILIDTFHVDLIINAGTAGGMDQSLKILDTVIATDLCYHDVADDILTESHPYMDSVFFKVDSSLIEKAKKAVLNERIENVFFGRIVTGEAFISEDGRERINKEFAPLAVDMESASVAHVCYVNSVPFMVIRTITDTPIHSGLDNFEVNCVKASNIARDITIAVLKELNV